MSSSLFGDPKKNKKNEWTSNATIWNGTVNSKWPSENLCIIFQIDWSKSINSVMWFHCDLLLDTYWNIGDCTRVCLRVPNLREIALLNRNLHFDHHPHLVVILIVVVVVVDVVFRLCFTFIKVLPNRCAGQTMQSYFPVAFFAFTVCWCSCIMLWVKCENAGRNCSI